jgi:hypothetical protein
MLRPLQTLAEFGRRFAENLDAEAARIDISRLCRTGLGPPPGLGGPVLAALATTIRERRHVRQVPAPGTQPRTQPGVGTAAARGLPV